MLVAESVLRDREITGTLLATVTLQIKRYLNGGLYQKCENNENLGEIFDADPSAEKIVFKENAQMSDAEVIFYYIRNAFAHGSFEVVEKGVRFYKLESRKNDTLKAQMILKEATLKKLAELSGFNRSYLENLQKKKKR